MSKVKNAAGDVAYAISRTDWKKVTGEEAKSDPVLVTIKPFWSRCEWEYNDDRKIWETECEETIECYSDYKFKFCPCCGKTISKF